jgi:hypothetical protein
VSKIKVNQKVPTRATPAGRRVSATYFIAVGCVFLSAALVSLHRHQIVRPHLVAHSGDTIGVTDVLLRNRSGEVADVGLAFLFILGPVGGIFRGSMLLAIVGVLLLFTAVLQYRRLRLGALVGVAWALGMVVLLMIAMGRISVSYSLAARLLMFGPALALNIGLLFVLGRRSTFLRQ